MIEKYNALANELLGGRQIAIPGIYDSLSAKIAEILEFPAAWVSGFCVSTSLFVPDENSLTADDYIGRIAEIRKVSEIPLIVDCDEGYGGIDNTFYLLRELVKLRVQAICIEDNAFPKVNSFKDVGDSRSPLESLDIFCEKLFQIKKAFPDLILIARTESLIIGESIDSAISRGKAYKSTGADYVVIHSKYRHLQQFKSIVDMWGDANSLVVIPTMAEDLTFGELKSLGFKIIILANQLLRSSINAMYSVYDKIKNDSGINELNKDTVSMKFIFDLIDKRYKPKEECLISK